MYYSQEPNKEPLSLVPLSFITKSEFLSSKIRQEKQSILTGGRERGGDKNIII